MRLCIERTKHPAPIAPTAVQSVPSWCDGGWDLRREEACYVHNFEVYWVWDGTDEEAGRAYFRLEKYIDLDQSSTSFTDSLELTLLRVSGALDNDDVMVNYEAECRRSVCSLDDGWSSMVNMSPGETKEVTARVGMAPGEGDILQDILDYKLTFDWESDDPGEWAKESTYSWYSATVRCDDALPGNALPGCVNDYVRPTYDTSPWPELADHVRDAQATGLEGKPGSGEPLHRLINPYWQEQNRNTACPKSLPRPEGESCDEYPMASTYEGAATRGDGRFSRRMIDEDHNSGGGRALSQFYRYKRVIQSDPFWVST